MAFKIWGKKERGVQGAVVAFCWRFLAVMGAIFAALTLHLLFYATRCHWHFSRTIFNRFFIAFMRVEEE